MEKKEIIFWVSAGLNFIGFLIFGWFLKNNLLINGDDGSKWAWLVVWMIIIAILISFLWLLTNQKRWAVGALGVCMLALLLAVGFKIEILITFLLAFLLLMSATWRVAKERLSRTKVLLWPILKAGLPSVFTALSLIVAIVFYFGPEAQRGIKSQLKVPEGLLRIIEKPIGALIQQEVGGANGMKFSFDMTIDDLVIAAIQQHSEIDIKQAAKDSKVKKQLDAQLLEARQGLAKQFGYGGVINGQDKLIDIVSTVMAQKIEGLMGPYSQYMPAVFAGGVFLILKGFSFIFVWIASLLAWLIFKLLLAVKIISIKEEPATRETII